MMLIGLEGFYRLDQKSFVNVKLAPGFRMEPVIKENPSHKAQFNSSATYNYRFAHLEYNRKDAVILNARQTESDRMDLFKYEFQAKKITNFYLAGGLDFSRFAHRTDLEPIDSLDSSYELTNSSALTLMGGIVRERYKYYAYSSSELLRRRCYAYYRVKNYFYMTYSPAINYKVSYFQMEEDEFGSSNGHFVGTNSGYIAPDVFNRLGWRFGSELKFQLTHFHNGPFLGIEFGQNYSIFSTGTQDETDGGYFLFRFGMEIGMKQ